MPPLRTVHVSLSQNQAYVAELQKSVYQYESKVDAASRDSWQSLQKRLEDLQDSSHDIYKDRGKLELLQCDHCMSAQDRYND